MKLFLGVFLGAIIFHFYSKRRIEAVMLLLIIALVKYEITLGSKIISLYEIISILLIFYTFFISSSVKAFKFYDRKIFKSVILFITSLFLSALFMRDDASLLGRLQLSFDYAFLFFITLFCLNTVKDIQTLIKGLHAGVLLFLGNE